MDLLTTTAQRANNQLNHNIITCGLSLVSYYHSLKRNNRNMTGKSRRRHCKIYFFKTAKFQCEVWLGHPASGGYRVHGPPAAGAVSPDEEGGVGGGLEPGGVAISPLTQSIVQQHPAAITKHLTRGLGVVTIITRASSTRQATPRKSMVVSDPHHGGQGTAECSGARTRGPELHTPVIGVPSGDQQPWNIINSQYSS